MSKLISTFEIKFDDETKAEIRALKAKLDKVALGLSVKNESSSLLETIQSWSAEKSKAANDDHPELKELGQWVFEGQDEKYVSAAVDGDGKAHLYPILKEELWFHSSKLAYCVGRSDYLKLEGEFSSIDWMTSAINRQPVNDNKYPSLKDFGQRIFEGYNSKWCSAVMLSDKGNVALFNIPIYVIANAKNEKTLLAMKHVEYVELEHVFDGKDYPCAIDRQYVNDVDYLSNNDLDDIVPHIDDVLALPNWLSDSVPQITQSDMQLIFIKNLSNVLIQRMHSMNRFSDDDYAIGGGDLIAWDIVFEPLTRSFGIFFGKTDAQSIGSFVFFTKPSKLAVNWDVNKAAFIKLRTITELELKDFLIVLEACYAE